MTFIERVRARLDLPLAEKSDVVRELESHLASIEEELIASGMDRQQAIQEATRRMGEPEEVASRLCAARCKAGWRSAIAAALAPVVLSALMLMVTPPSARLVAVAGGAMAAAFGLCMMVLSLREIRHERVPVWLPTTLAIGIGWLWMSGANLPWLTHQIGVSYVVVVFYYMAAQIAYVLAAAVFVAWESLIATGKALPVFVILAVAAVCAAAAGMLFDTPREEIIGALMMFALVPIIGIIILGSREHGRPAQCSLFLFTFYMLTAYPAVSGYVNLMWPQYYAYGPYLLFAGIAVGITAGTTIVYARARSWTAKQVAILCGLLTSGVMAWFVTFPGHDPISNASVPTALAAIVVVVIPFLIGQWQERLAGQQVLG